MSSKSAPHQSQARQFFRKELFFPLRPHHLLSVFLRGIIQWYALADPAEPTSLRCITPREGGATLPISVKCRASHIRNMSDEPTATAYARNSAPPLPCAGLLFYHFVHI
jgi:hypothetical protein